MTEHRPVILVIDDEEGIREGCRRALASEGYEILLAESGQAGLAYLAEQPVDLVLLDIMMPGMNGMQVLQRMMEADPELVVVIVTGYATVDLAIEAIKQGAYDFLSKPFDAATLQLAVRQGLEKRRLSLQAKELAHSEAETKRLEQEKAELQRLNQLKSSFTLLVAHELRAPVAAIQSYLKLILEGYVPETRFIEIVTRAERRAREQLALISDLLDLARITGGPPEEDALDDVAIEAVLDEIYELLEAQAQEKDLTVRFDVDPELPSIRASVKHVQQLWINLLSNAIKYTPEQGSVEVSLHAEDGEIVGAVRDTGIGIPEEELPKIFEDFYRCKNAKDFERMGTGLGLSIVKAIIDLYDGEIEVDSVVGEGSTFTFSLPVAAPSQPPSRVGEAGRGP